MVVDEHHVCTISPRTIYIRLCEIVIRFSINDVGFACDLSFDIA